MTKRRLSRRDLTLFAGGVARRDGMVRPLAEVLCYRTGTLRAVDRGSVRAVARKHDVPASSLYRNVKVAEDRIVRAFRLANRVNRED